MKRETKAEPAPVKMGSWKVTEELDSIQCPICKGYNRLSISSDKTHVYCAECGDRITEAYLKTQCFDLRVALERESNPAPAQCGQHTPGPWRMVILERGTPQTINGRVHSTAARKEIRIIAGEGTIAEVWKIRSITRGPHGDDSNSLSESNARLIAAAPELLEALRELLTSEESPHSETVRYLAREQARTILAKIGGQQ